MEATPWEVTGKTKGGEGSFEEESRGPRAEPEWMSQLGVKEEDGGRNRSSQGGTRSGQGRDDSRSFQASETGYLKCQATRYGYYGDHYGENPS